VQEHSTYLGIEPISGATMLARKRLQFSVLLQPQVWPDPLNASVTLSWFSALQPILTPIVWFQESGQITADKAALFASTVYVARSARLWVPIICGVLFLVALGFAIALASDRTSVEAPEDDPAFRRPLDVSVAETSKRPLLVNHF
jgi:hypothetical protein